MIFSFPIDAWLLLFVAVGLGLALEIAFYRKHRHSAVAESDGASMGGGDVAPDSGSSPDRADGGDA